MFKQAPNSTKNLFKIRCPDYIGAGEHSLNRPRQIVTVLNLMAKHDRQFERKSTIPDKRILAQMLMTAAKCVKGDITSRWEKILNHS
jgi:hypothetical protein